MDHGEGDIESIIDGLSSRDSSRNMTGLTSLLKFQARAKDITHFMPALLVRYLLSRETVHTLNLLIENGH